MVAARRGGDVTEGLLADLAVVSWRGSVLWLEASFRALAKKSSVRNRSCPHPCPFNPSESVRECVTGSWVACAAAMKTVKLTYFGWS